MATRKNFTKDDKVWKSMKRNLRSKKASVDLGWFEGQRYGPDNDNLPMAQVAQWVEEGHINGGMFKGTRTPPRPAIRTYFIPLIAESSDFSKMAYPLIHDVAMGKLSWAGLHEKIAPKLLYRFKLALKQFMTPGNSPTTISIKGFNNPWIETGNLVESARFRVSNAKLLGSNNRYSVMYGPMR